MRAVVVTVLLGLLAAVAMAPAASAAHIAGAHALFLLPPITNLRSHEHAGFARAVSISARILHVEGIRASLQSSGILKLVLVLVLVNGHGGNYVLSNVTREANGDGPHVTLFPAHDDWEAARRGVGLATNASEDMHAGEL